MTTFNEIFNMPAIENHDTTMGMIFSRHLSSFPEIAHHYSVQKSYSESLTDECLRLIDEDSRIEVKLLIDNKYVSGQYERYGKKLVVVFFEKKPLFVGLFAGDRQQTFSCSIVDKPVYDAFVYSVLDMHLKTLSAEELEYVNDSDNFVKLNDSADHLLEYAQSL